MSNICDRKEKEEDMKKGEERNRTNRKRKDNIWDSEKSLYISEKKKKKEKRMKKKNKEKIKGKRERNEEKESVKWGALSGLFHPPELP